MACLGQASGGWWSPHLLPGTLSRSPAPLREDLSLPSWDCCGHHVHTNNRQVPGLHIQNSVSTRNHVAPQGSRAWQGKECGSEEHSGCRWCLLAKKARVASEKWESQRLSRRSPWV